MGGISVKKTKEVPRILTIVLLLLAIAAGIFGAVRGEIKTVNRKSTNICMECIGIG